MSSGAKAAMEFSKQGREDQSAELEKVSAVEQLEEAGGIQQNEEAEIKASAGGSNDGEAGNEEEEMEDGSKGEAGALMSPRPTRKRKEVKKIMLHAPPKKYNLNRLFILPGQGTKLREIPNVAYKLSRRKADENLNLLHTILFGRKAKVYNLKKNIGRFSGFVWFEDELKQRTKLKEKIERCSKEKLLDFCDVLNIPVVKTTVKKEELCAKLLEFLDCPRATTDVLLAETEKKRKRRKIDDSSSKRKMTDEDDVVDKLSEEESSDYWNNSENETDDDQPKADIDLKRCSSKEKDADTSSAKSYSISKQSPAEAPNASGRSTEECSASASLKAVDDAEPKTVRAEPGEEELRAEVVNILKRVDLYKVLLSDVLVILGEHFGMDLHHRKPEVKAMIIDTLKVLHRDDEASSNTGDESGDDDE